MAIVPTDEDELSTLTETSLHISTSSDVTKCRDDLILPPSLPLHGKGLYAATASNIFCTLITRSTIDNSLLQEQQQQQSLPTMDSDYDNNSAEKSSFTNSNHEENFEYNKMDESSSSSSSSSIYPYDEPQPSATCTGVPGFPDFAWNNDSNDDNRNGVQERSNTGDGITTTTTTTNAGLSNWEARRRLDSILAASSLGSVTRRNHHQQQQRRRLERLRRKAVNMNKNIMTVRTTDSHSRHPFIMMEDDTDCRAVVVWKPKPYHTRGQQSCHQITKNNWIRKTKRSAVKYKGWRRQQQQQQQQRFHRSARLETIAEHESEGKTNNIINTSRLGLEERFRFKREQHDLLDLQTGMKYLGL